MKRVKIHRFDKSVVEYYWDGDSFPPALELVEARGERLALLEYRKLTVDTASDGAMVASYGLGKKDRR